MKGLRWNPVKNEWLRITRGMSFDDLTNHGTFLGSRYNPARAGQEMLLFEYRGYVWLVPYVNDRSGKFLKTLYPSRKYTKRYRQGVL